MGPTEWFENPGNKRLVKLFKRRCKGGREVVGTCEEGMDKGSGWRRGVGGGGSGGWEMERERERKWRDY